MMATLDPRTWYRKLFPTARRLLIESDIHQSCVDEHRRVLIIGAGHDPYRSRFPGAELYVALDVIEFAGATDVIADAVSLPFCDESFDCVVAIEVMEHVDNPVRLIEEACRVLGSGKPLMVSVPFVYHMHADPSDYWRPTYQALEKAAEGFSETTIRSQGNRLHSISDLVTTAFYPYSILWPLRILNHLLVLQRHRKARINKSTAPSGYFMIAKK